MMRRQMVLFVAWLVVGCGGTQASNAHFGQVESEPTIWHVESEPIIAITPPDPSGTFHFSLCGDDTMSPGVRRIGVYPGGQTLSGPIVVSCVWSRDDGASLSDWKYASKPQGSHLSGACQPLAIGSEYEVFVSGVGSGHLIFKLDEVGGVLVGRELGSQCPVSRSTFTSIPRANAGRKDTRQGW